MDTVFSLTTSTSEQIHSSLLECGTLVSGSQLIKVLWLVSFLPFALFPYCLQVTEWSDASSFFFVQSQYLPTKFNFFSHPRLYNNDCKCQEMDNSFCTKPDLLGKRDDQRLGTRLSLSYFRKEICPKPIRIKIDLFFD